ncbi:hypothetical protein G3A43_06195 [Paraburkholderia aspalathi]|nr:hypothetical protein [Paraburkholderia aspalathi]MBK3779838.1 hypothetical protein [Paraburkholderia aspalathi]
MKKRLILAAASLACSSAVFAADPLPAVTPAPVDPLLAANNHYSVQFGLSNLSYHEADNENQVGGGRALDSEHGNQVAMQEEWSRQGALLGIPGVYTALGLTLSGGPTSYDGQAIDLKRPNGIGDSLTYHHASMMLDVDAKLGKALRVLPRLQVTPYLKYDFNFWKRSALETYTHHELGLGLLSQYALTPRTVVGVDVAVTKTLGAQVATTDGVTEQVSSRWTQSVGLTGDYALSRHLHLLASYQFRHFSYGKSAYVAGRYDGMQAVWFEPTSRTTTHMVMAGLSYNF